MRDAVFATGVVVFAVALALLALREARRLREPLRLLGDGRYDAARLAAQAVARSWAGRFSRVRDGARYVDACAAHLAGDMEESLRALATIARPAEDLAYGVASLEAANLVLLGRDPARAKAILTGLVRAPEDDLLLALALHALGDPSADGVFVSARPEDLAKSRLAEDKRPIFHCLRGLYLVARGRGAEAGEDFRAAASAKHASWYAARARSLAPRDGEGPRSTLAPQILD